VSTEHLPSRRYERGSVTSSDLRPRHCPKVSGLDASSRTTALNPGSHTDSTYTNVKEFLHSATRCRHQGEKSDPPPPSMLHGLCGAPPADQSSNQILDHSVQNHPKTAILLSSGVNHKVTQRTYADTRSPTNRCVLRCRVLCAAKDETSVEFMRPLLNSWAECSLVISC
jgi:hypothetical protein